jgi:hypothetical protein
VEGMWKKDAFMDSFEILIHHLSGRIEENWSLGQI